MGIEGRFFNKFGIDRQTYKDLRKEMKNDGATKEEIKEAKSELKTGNLSAKEVEAYLANSKEAMLGALGATFSKKNDVKIDAKTQAYIDKTPAEVKARIAGDFENNLARIGNTFEPETVDFAAFALANIKGADPDKLNRHLEKGVSEETYSAVPEILDMAIA